MPELRLKRIYEEASDEDGYRVLVDRLWPRGVSKEKAHLDLWAREAAPSMELRRWFNHEPDKFPEFQSRYFKELEKNEKAEAFRNMVREKLKDSNITLLFSARDEACNNAVVLRDWLMEE
ncbi:MAG: DUF488 family protein [Lachnospiraceae bacterium]|nr:DUF488 family protein [Lachnospiraceae bacterium]